MGNEIPDVTMIGLGYIGLPTAALIAKQGIRVHGVDIIQVEAPALGEPVVTMRHTTETPEAVEAGTVELVGTDKNLIIKKVSELISDFGKYEEMSKAHNPYGDGKASKLISNLLKEFDL